MKNNCHGIVHQIRTMETKMYTIHTTHSFIYFLKSQYPFISTAVTKSQGYQLHTFAFLYVLCNTIHISLFVAYHCQQQHLRIFTLKRILQESFIIYCLGRTAFGFKLVISVKVIKNQLQLMSLQR